MKCSVFALKPSCRHVYTSPGTRILGINWHRADGHWETVHRFRVGLWYWVLEAHWWKKGYGPT
jgi:hypothetical protein